jgi:hypothetical protein
MFLNGVRASRPEKFKPAKLTAQFAARQLHLKGSVAAPARPLSSSRHRQHSVAQIHMIKKSHKNAGNASHFSQSLLSSLIIAVSGTEFQL